VDNPDRSRALRAYAAATLWAVQRGLRSGRLFLPYASEYRVKERLLMHATIWSTTRDAFLERRQLPVNPEPFLDRVVAQVEVGMAALDEKSTGDVSKEGYMDEKRLKLLQDFAERTREVARQIQQGDRPADQFQNAGHFRNAKEHR
jgi:hypothetical protein